MPFFRTSARRSLAGTVPTMIPSKLPQTMNRRVAMPSPELQLERGSVAHHGDGGLGRRADPSGSSGVSAISGR